MSTSPGEKLTALRAAAVLCATLSACVNNYAPIVTDTARPTVVLRGLQITSTATPISTAQFIVPTPAPIGPTATPHTHTIRSGDTLIDIAAKNGLSVEALQLFNAGIDPRALQVGQKLLIPFSGEETAAGYFPSPTPLPVNLSAFRCDPTPSGGQLCIGEAVNSSGQAIINLAVQVTVVLPNGELGPSQVTFAPVKIVMPGERAPLIARFSDLDTVLGVVSQVVAAQDGSVLMERYLTLSVGASSSVMSTPGHYTVSTAITNDTEHEAREIVVLISGYNSAKELRVFRIVDIEHELPAGNSVEFTTTITVPDKEISRFEVSARAHAESQ